MWLKTKLIELPKQETIKIWIDLSSSEAYFSLVWFVWFYGISTFVGYLTPNLFLCK